VEVNDKISAVKFDVENSMNNIEFRAKVVHAWWKEKKKEDSIYIALRDIPERSKVYVSGKVRRGKDGKAKIYSGIDLATYPTVELEIIKLSKTPKKLGQKELAAIHEQKN
jgi:hypothetical protein